MADFILVKGDKAMYLPPTFSGAIVFAPPGTLTGSGPAKIGGKEICVLGDEASATMENVSYIAPPFVIPGMGTVEIIAFDPGDDKHVAEITSTGGKKVLLKGTPFKALFTVETKAQMIVPGSKPEEDQSPDYEGQGMFLNTNFKIKGK